LLLHVMAGDKVEMNVNSYYDTYSADDDNPETVENMLGSIVSTLAGGAGGFEGGEAHNTKIVNDAFTSANFDEFNTIVDGQTAADKPKAYLNYILFDENMRVVKNMSGAFQSSGDGTWAEIGTDTPMEIPVNGYLAVYLSNRSVSDVFFDQLVLRFTRGALKEETHYYPFGLPIGTLGSAATGFKENRDRYQSNGYNREQGLNWMDFHNRQYDPQLGRFTSIDPLAAATAHMSPYTGMNNDPVSTVDPMGLIGLPNLVAKFGFAIPLVMWPSLSTPKTVYNGPGPDREAALGGFNSDCANRAFEKSQADMERAAMGAQAENDFLAAGGANLSNNDCSHDVVSKDDNGGDLQAGDGNGRRVPMGPFSPVDDSGGDPLGHIWYYMYRETGGAHAMVYDRLNDVIYDINSWRDKNEDEIPVVKRFADHPLEPLSVAYQYRREYPKEWTMLSGREDGNQWALCPIYVPNPADATAWFQSHTGEGWRYNAGGTNCSIYVMLGLRYGGAVIGHPYGNPAPSNVNSTPALHWTFPLNTPRP